MNKLNNYALFWILFAWIPMLSVAQNGPGGVGNTTGTGGQPHNKFWLDASRLSLANDASVDSFIDYSGNNNHATQLTAAAMPLFKTSQINGLPVVYFDPSGTPDVLSFDGNQIVGTDYTVLYVGTRRTNGAKWVMGGTGTSNNTNLHFGWESSNTSFRYHHYGNDLTGVALTTGAGGTAAGTYGIFSLLCDDNDASSDRYVYQNNLLIGQGATPTHLSSYPGSVIGGAPQVSSYSDLNIAEVIIYSNALNNAQLAIVNQYLAEKYNITISNDRFVGNNASFNKNLFGIGQESNGNHTLAGQKGMYLKALSSLDNGDYVMAADANVNNEIADFRATAEVTASGAQKAWNRDWYLDKTGNLNARVSFDFGEGVTGGLYPQNYSNYVLLYRAANSGNYSQVITASGVLGDQVYFDLTDVQLVDGYYTLGTLNETDSPLQGAPGKKWYTLASGDWSDPNIWTLDPSGTLPNNPENLIPGSNDKVFIKSGKNITVSVNNLLTVSITIEGRLDLGSTSGHNFVEIRGNGRILLSSDNFPAGDATHFTSEGQGMGAVVFYGTDYTLNTPHTFYNMEVDLNASTNVITLLANYTLNGSLTLSTGKLKINDDASPTILTLDVANDITVNVNGSIIVGAGNTASAYSVSGTLPIVGNYHSIYHMINVGGNLFNYGIIKLTNESAPRYDQLSYLGAATLKMHGASDNSLVCENTTILYNLVIDKGSDKTYILTLNSSNTNNFALFGANILSSLTGGVYTSATPELRKALFIKNGTLKLTGSIHIPTLSEGGVDFQIGANSQLWIASSAVSVYTTASAQNQIPNYTTTAIGVNTGTGVQALSVFGKFRITEGFMGTRNSAGIIFWSSADGQVNIDGGTVNVAQVRSANGGGGVASYIQTAGTVYVRGNQTEAGQVDNGYPIFGFDDATGVFNMSGGTLYLQDIGGSNTNGLYLPSADGNYNVTGGNIIIELNSADNFEIGSNAPLFNLELKRLTGASTVIVRLTDDLKVLGDLTINDYCRLDVQNDLDLVNYNLYIGDDFIFRQHAEFYARNSNTYFNGTLNSDIVVYDITNNADLTFYNLIIDKEQNYVVTTYDKVEIDGRTRTTGYPVEILGNLTVTRGDFYTEDYAVNLKGNIEVTDGKITNGTGKIILNSTAAQHTLKGSLTTQLEFGRLELNSTFGAKLLSNITVTSFALNVGIMNLDVYNLKVTSGISTTGTYSTTLMYQTAGNAGDGGLSLYIGATGTYLFPLGTNANTSVRYTPAWVDVNTFSDNGYIRISVADEDLPTALSPGGNVLSYYWRVRHSDFTTKPTVHFTFKASDLDDPSDNNDGDISIPSAIVGEIQNESPYVRSNVSGEVDKSKIGGTVANNNLYFYTASRTLSSASYTCGKNTSFNGTLEVFYTTSSGIGNWDSQTKWTKTSNGVDDGNSGYPQAGDVAIIKSYGNSNQNAWVYGNINITVGEVVFDNSLGGWNPRIWVTKNDALLNLGEVSGTGEICLEVLQAAQPSFVGATDLTAFSNEANSVFNFKIDADNQVVNMPNNISVYPNIRIEAGEGVDDDDNRILQTSIPIQVKGTVRLDRSSRFRINHNTSIVNDLRITWQNRRTTVEIGDDRQITLDIGGDLYLENGDGTDGARFLVENTSKNSWEHTVRVGGSIIFESGLNATSVFDLYNGAAPNNNAILELYGTNDGAFTNSTEGGTEIVPDLYRIVMNKETSADKFTFNDRFTLNGATNGDVKAITLNSGTLALEDAEIDVTLSSGGANFKIPLDAKLTSQYATLRISGTNTGIWLDGSMTVGYSSKWYLNEGDNNYIEYTSSGISEIKVFQGTLLVGSHIRRATTTEEGILNFDVQHSNNTIVIGTDNSIPTNNRGVLEILNSGSNLTMVDNAKIIIANAQTSATFPSLYLNPETYSLGTNSTIQIGNSNTRTGQIIGVYSAHPLVNLTLDNTSANNPSAKLMIADHTLNGNLTINSGTTFNANALDVNIKGDFTNTGTFTPNGNTVYFTGASTQTITGSVNFFNIVKDTTSNTLILASSALVSASNLFSIQTGTFNDGGNTVSVYGNIENNAVTLSSGSSAGIYANGAESQTLTGNGTFARFTINNISGVQIPTGNNITISDELRLQNGIFNIGKNLLTLTSDADIVEVAPFSETNMIQTNISFTDAGVKKIFPIISTPTTFVYPMGSNNKFTPVTFNITANGNNTGSIRVKAADEAHVSVVEDDEPIGDPSISDINNVLWYHWIMDASGMSGFSADAILQGYASDVHVTAPYSAVDYITAMLLDSTAGTWAKFTADDFNQATTELYFNYAGTNDEGIDGDYTAGIDNAIPDVIPSYVTISDGDWTDKGIWSPTPPDGGPKGARVCIRHHVTTPSNFITSYCTRIGDTGQLFVGNTFGHRLGNVFGTGELILERGDLPAGVYDGFFAADSGTLVFQGSTDYDILSEITSINNLKLTGTGDRRLPNLQVQLNGDLLIDGPDVVNEHDETFLIKGDITYNSGTFDAGVGGNAKIVFNGTQGQTVSGLLDFTGANGFNIIEVDGNGVNFNTSANIEQKLILSLGTINTIEAEPFTVTNVDLSAVEGGSSVSFVDGPLFKNISNGESFIFPVGDASRFGKIEISNTSTGTAQVWMAQYYNYTATQDGYSTTDFNSTLGYVYNDGYWRVKSAVAGTANVKARWDTQTNVSADATIRDELRLGLWDNLADPTWIEIGATVTNTSQSLGYVQGNTISFNEFSNGNYFAIASDVLNTNFTWNGNTSTAWETASNWTPATVPTSEANVTIPTTPSGNKFPVISTHVIVRDLIVSNNASLTVNATYSLTVNSGMQVGTGATVLLKTTSDGHASLLTNGTITNNGNNKMELYITANKFHYIGSPVSAQDTTVFSTQIIKSLPNKSNPNWYKYNEAYSGTITDYAWDRPNEATMDVALGYAYGWESNYTHTLQGGTFNNGTISQAITKSGSNPANTWNLISNPYPSAISVADFVTANGASIEGAVYLWDDDGSLGVGYSSSDYTTITQAGYTVGTGSGIIPNGLIAAGQAFFVKALSNTNVSFTNSMRRATSGKFFKKGTEEEVVNPGIRLSVVTPLTGYNEIFITYRSDATDGYDRFMDGEKLENPSAKVALFSISAGKKFAVNALSSLKDSSVVVLGMSTADAGKHIFSLKELTGLDPEVNVYLRDKLTGTLTNLRTTPNDTVMLAAGEYLNRFELVIKEPEITTTEWKGMKSGSWNTATNWDNGVPTRYKNAKVTSGSVVVSSEMQFNDLIVSGAAAVTINENTQLNARGNVILEADGDNTGTLVDYDGKSNIKAIVRKKMSSPDRYYYLTAPTVDAMAGVFGTTQQLSGTDFNERKMYYWDGAWKRVTHEGTYMVPLRGYIVKASDYAGITYEFNGVLNTGLIEYDLPKKGFQLIGNPYPSAIDWGFEATPNGWTDTDSLMATIWYRVGGTGGVTGGGNFATYNRLSGFSTNGGTRYIPAMQAFWVKVVSPTVITINNQTRTAESTSFFKSAATSQGIKFTAKLNGFTDEAIIFHNVNAKDDADNYDSEKYFADGLATPQLYSYSADNKALAVNGYSSFTENQEVMLGIKTTGGGTVVLDFEALNGFENNTLQALLVDKLLNDTIELAKTPMYTFETEAGDITDRFVVLFTLKSTTGIENGDNDNILVWGANNQINMNFGELKVSKVEVTDVLGRIVNQSVNPGSSELKLDVAQNGVYVVSISTNRGTIQRKVHVK